MDPLAAFAVGGVAVLPEIILFDSPLSTHHIVRILFGGRGSSGSIHTLSGRFVRVVSIVRHKGWLRWRRSHCHRRPFVGVVVPRGVHPPRSNRDYTT